MSILRFLLFGTILMLAGCNWLEFQALKLYLHFNQNLKIEDGPVYITSGSGIYSVSAIYEGLQFPWDLAFINENEILVTEKPGRLTRINLRTGDASLIQGVPVVSFKGQGGLLGVELHPRYASNQVVYLSYTASPDSGENQIRLLRARLVGNSLVEQQIIFRALPIVDGLSNLGGAIAIGEDERIMLSVGEHQSRENLQNLNSHLGTIVRLNDDGSIPKDNPFIDDVTARPEIYSYGHRNPQGISIDKRTGTIWSAEHGPKDGDEINIIKAGGNYGWPIVSYGTEYDGTPFATTTEKYSVEEPKYYYNPGIAPAGLLFYSGMEYPDWNNRLLVGSLIGTHINLVNTGNDKLVEEARLLKDLTMRVRGISISPQGKIFFLTENGILLRVDPKI